MILLHIKTVCEFQYLQSLKTTALGALLSSLHSKKYLYKLQGNQTHIDLFRMRLCLLGTFFLLPLLERSMGLRYHLGMNLSLEFYFVAYLYFKERLIFD